MMEKMATIPVDGCGLVAVVDDEFAPLLLRHRWVRMRGGPRRSLTFAATYLCGRLVNMDRLVFGSPPRGNARLIHLNGNGLDNRLENLAMSPVQPKRSPREIPYRGVYLDARRLRKPYRAVFKTADGLKHLGSFATAEEAARVYDRAALERYGEFALLNFPAAAAEGR